MNRQRAILFASAALICAISLTPPAEASGPFTGAFEEIADGVWVGVRPDSPRLPVMGTTTFVISDAGVVVFDGGGMTLMAEHVIGKIRSLTNTRTA